MCDKKMPAWLKGKVYKVMIRPVMTYTSETWAIKTKQEKKLDVAEMKMPSWSLGKTRKDKIRNYAVGAALGVRAVSEKVQGNRLRWKSSRTNRNSRKKNVWETNAYVEVENKKRYEGPWLEPGYGARQRSLETKHVHGGPHDKWDNAFDIR